MVWQDPEMAWQDPKLDWKTNPTNPVKEDFNRIEGNIDFLKGDIETKKGAIVSAINGVGIECSLTDTHAQLAAKITGSNQGAKIITPSTANQTILKGFHNGSGYVIGDVNLAAPNIKYGKTIFGVTGSFGKLQDVLLYPQTFTLSERQNVLGVNLDAINNDDFMSYLVVMNPLLHDAIIQSSVLLPASVSKNKIWGLMLNSQTVLNKILGTAAYFNSIKSQYGGLPLFNGADSSTGFTKMPSNYVPDPERDLYVERAYDHMYLYYYIYGAPYLGMTSKLSFDLTHVNNVQFEWEGVQPASRTRAYLDNSGVDNAYYSAADICTDIILKRDASSWSKETSTINVSGILGNLWFKISLWSGINNRTHEYKIKLYQLWLK